VTREVLNFIGCDHGTTELRFALETGTTFSLARERAANTGEEQLLSEVLSELDVHPDEVGLFALSYSMGDAIDGITRIDEVKKRGVLPQGGTGAHVGGGTRWYDAVASSGLPAVVVPGLHRRNYRDDRFGVYSHGASGEKVGLCFGLAYRGRSDFLVGDVSSNTVSLAVRGGLLLGAIDAPIFAPGTTQGPLDVELLRKVDGGSFTANRAFSSAGPMPRGIFESSEDAEEAIALFAAMELAGLGLLVPDAEIFLTGSLGSKPGFAARVSELLGRAVSTLDRFAAAKGMAVLARAVYSGAEDVMGLKVLR